MGKIADERFRTGNVVSIFMNGDTQPLGFGIVGGRLPGAQNIGAGINTGARHLHEIGDPEPIEIVDGAHTYDLTLSKLTLRDQEAVERVNAGSVNIHLIDKFNGKTIRVAEGCKLANSQLALPANQLVNENVSFLALRITG